MARKLDAKRIEAIRIHNAEEHRSNREREEKRQWETQERERVGSKTYEIKPNPTSNAESSKKLRVAAYCRVSTQEEAQLGSFESQCRHFQHVIENNPEWESARIFADEGISGTSVSARKGFQDMIAAAKNHEIDLILTKDMSRFGRNSLEILTNLKLLNDLNPPVAVNFESPGISSIDPKNNLLIAILSALAELESQQKSEAIKAGIRYRMREGTFKFTIKNTLGYYRDHFGRIKIEPAEAEIVKYIYESFLEGVSVAEIARALTGLEISTPMGRMVWRESTVRGILRNEKYCGDVLFQKTVTVNYLSHKAVKNRDIISHFVTEDHHVAIIPKETWKKTQEQLSTRKGVRESESVKRFVKSFSAPRIKSGALKGYYLLGCNWSREERECFLKIIESMNRLPRE